MKPTADASVQDINRAIVLRPLASAEESVREGEARLLEAVGLAQALELDIASAEAAPLRKISPRTYFGSGRVERLKAQAETLGAGLIVVDAALSPVQQRNLEQDIGAKVIDRTGLILEIFGLRARTKEGRLQVELARQHYERSRLVRTWTHLERQRGGLGKMGGPGETQIETDRRLIQNRIDRLKLDLEKVRASRAQQRRARTRAGLPAVVFVGYTNAGKSTLFNRMTSAGVLAKDMVFATLDPTARRVETPSGRPLIVADTVGFITDLPTELVASFRATLEAVSEADVLVHVRDIAHPETDAQAEDVRQVLSQVGAKESQVAIEAWNKIDLLSEERRAARIARGGAETVAVSALTGEGVDTLLEAIDRAAYGPTQAFSFLLDPADGRTRALIASQGRILSETIDPSGQLALRAELPLRVAERLSANIASAEKLAVE